VPSHPQPIIRLCAIAEDFAGNQNIAQAQWQVIAKVTTGTWTIQYRVDLTCADCRAAG